MYASKQRSPSRALRQLFTKASKTHLNPQWCLFWNKSFTPLENLIKHWARTIHRRRFDVTKNKKLDADALVSSQDPAVDFVVADEAVLQEYMKSMDFSQLIGPERERNVYKRFKEALNSALSAGQKNDVVLAALIERIARTAVFLEKLERLMVSAEDVFNMASLKFDQKDYLQLQAEHRKCLEMYCNLKFLEKKKVRTTVLEELRRTVSRESDEAA